MKSNAHLRLSLQKAHVEIRPDVYLSFTYLNSLTAFALSLLFVAGLIVLGGTGRVGLSRTVLFALVPLPLISAFSTYAIGYFQPDLIASKRSRDINAKLPYALNYIATMASAGMTPERIFSGLAQQPVYGEVANEAAWITRDLRMLGRDVVTALTQAIDRSPSLKFQDLLQGAITTITSGGQLKDYLLSKSEQFILDNRQDQKKFLENLGILAESFITLVVAGPIFIIVMLSVMTTFGGNPRTLLLSGYVIILLVMPITQFGFAIAIKSATPEA